MGLGQVTFRDGGVSVRPVVLDGPSDGFCLPLSSSDPPGSSSSVRPLPSKRAPSRVETPSDFPFLVKLLRDLRSPGIVSIVSPCFPEVESWPHDMGLRWSNCTAVVCRPWACNGWRRCTNRQ